MELGVWLATLDGTEMGAVSLGTGEEKEPDIPDTLGKNNERFGIIGGVAKRKDIREEWRVFAVGFAPNRVHGGELDVTADVRVSNGQQGKRGETY